MDCGGWDGGNLILNLLFTRVSHSKAIADIAAIINSHLETLQCCPLTPKPAGSEVESPTKLIVRKAL